MKADQKPKLITSPLHLVIALVVLFSILFFFQLFLLKSYRIPSESMSPTIKPGERIIVDRFAYRFSDPKAGDVIVFRAPRGAAEGRATCANLSRSGICLVGEDEKDGQDFIKRVVAVPGDRIKLIRGRLFVNGKEGYPQFACKKNLTACHFPETTVIPKNRYFLLGDNRENSYDSRFWGTVTKDVIIGQARLSYWPPDRFGTFGN